MATVDTNVREINFSEIYLSISCLSIVNKLFKKVVSSKLVDPENCVYFLISNTFLGLFV